MDVSAISDQTALGRLLRLPLRLIPRSAVLPILQGPLRGRRWVAGSLTHGCWLGTYEYDKQRLLARTLEPGDVFYDVGANVGFYSLLAAACVGTQGRVVAFEPLPDNGRMLRRHMELNGVSNVQLVEAAVSDAAGTARFETGPTHAMGRIGDGEGVEVRVVALDELLERGELPPPRVIKMDIEGAEYAALRGARRLLERHRPTLFLATHGADVHRDCCALLGELGYALRSLDARPLAETDEVLAEPARDVT